MLSFMVHAQSITASLQAADTVLQGTAVTLTFELDNLPLHKFELPELVGLTVVGRPSKSTQVSIINGNRTSSAVLRYSVLAEQVGLAYVPEVEITHKNESYSTEALQLFITADENYVPLEKRTEDSTQPAAKRKRPTVRL